MNSAATNTLPTPTGRRSARWTGAMSPPAVFVHHRKSIRILLHGLLIPFGYVTAYLLRFEFEIPAEQVRGMLLTLPLLVAIRVGTFAHFRVHNGWWRHAGLYDLVELAKAITVGSGLFVAALFLTRQSALVPRSIPLLEWGAAILAFGGVRFAARWLRESGWSRVRDGRRALFIGADDTAASFIRELRKRPRSRIVPLGLVDDDPLKSSLKLHGISVLGTTADLPRLVAEHRVQLLIVTIPDPTRQVMRKIAERCARLDVELKVVPTLSELLDGTAHVGQLRHVSIEELLGRSPVNLELDRVVADLRDKVVMITGGAGSIGSELARQVAAAGPKRLVLVEQAESPLYFVHLELARRHPQLELLPRIADITDARRLAAVFAETTPEYVFHAAAYKHVPLMEANLPEAIRNNIFGTLTTARQAALSGVRKFVLISTDKAVKPSSVMGATKRAAERIVLGLRELTASSTDFRVVRFGNVLDSEGSVVPLFRRQIAAGGPVTVTDPTVTRYFMTIPEAVQLVLQATALPEASERIAMLDMGRPVRILDLAENMIRLSGLEPYAEMPIIFTGLRPGEKLHEELVSDIDCMVPTSVDQIWTATLRDEDGAHIRSLIDRMTRALESDDQNRMLLTLCSMVPECMPPLRERASRIAGTDPQLRWWQPSGDHIQLGKATASENGRPVQPASAEHV